MTDSTLLAKGYQLLAEGYATLALAVQAHEQAPAASSASSPALTPVPVPEGGGGECLIHGEPWKIVPAGVSKAGKAYGAFAACPERGCRERPTPAWYALHPPA